MREFFRGWRHTMIARVALPVATHPVTLTLGFLVSVVLWMPYGFGYYDFPWQRPVAVFALLTFVLASFVCSSVTFVLCYRSRIAKYRVALSGLSLLMAVHGLSEMLHWWFYMSGWREVPLWLAVWPLALLSTYLLLWPRRKQQEPGTNDA